MIKDLKQAWNDFQVPGNYTKWWLVILPVIILSIVGSVESSILSGIASVVLLGLTGMIASVRIKAYYTPATTKPSWELDEHKPKFIRDFFAGILYNVPFVVVFFTLIAISLPTIIITEHITWLLSLLVLGLLPSMAGLLYIYTYIPFSLTPYILAIDKDISVWDALGLSFDIMNEKEEYKTNVINYTVAVLMIYAVSLLSFMIPLIATLPFIVYLQTRIYVDILEDAGYLTDEHTEVVSGKVGQDYTSDVTEYDEDEDIVFWNSDWDGIDEDIESYIDPEDIAILKDNGYTDEDIKGIIDAIEDDGSDDDQVLENTNSTDSEDTENVVEDEVVNTEDEDTKDVK